MRVLKFKVSGQTLEPIEIPNGIVPGTKGYLRCEFDVSSDSSWAGCTLIAEFNESEAMMIRNGRCSIPDNISARSIFKIRLHGIRGKSYRIVTNNVTIKL